MLHIGYLSIRHVRPRVVLPKFMQYSTTPSLVVNAEIEKHDNIETSKTYIQERVVPSKNIDNIKSSNLVASAFAALKSEANINTLEPLNKNKFSKKNVTDEIIAEATTVDAILSIAEAPIVSRRHALKVVSVLADWASTGKAKLSDFETNPKFLKLCRILGRNNAISNIKDSSARVSSRNTSSGDDLSTVLGVTGDDEAAKLVASISLPQMVKVLSALAQKRRRSTPLLRSLAYNITKSSDKLDLKQCADVLYAAAALTFPELPLLERVCSDLCQELPNNTEKSSVIGSILTSIGLLRYKNMDVLNSISEWIVEHHEICRPQDICSLFVTLAMVSYHPTNSEELYKIVVPQLNIDDVTKPSVWVDVVWSLVVLNQATNEHFKSVLDPDFLSRLNRENCLTVQTKIKLLNIQAAATVLHKSYNGPLIAEGSDVHTVTIVRSREKQTLVAAMLDSLGSLLPSVTYLKSNVDTGMGFLLDGECLVDNKCNPLPVTENENTANGIKVGFMAYDYHDLCRGNRAEPNGMNVLAKQLLEEKGYTILAVPHTDFNPRDKLVRRVQYLATQLKAISRLHK